jgi:hypothetical protein
MQMGVPASTGRKTKTTGIIPETGGFYYQIDPVKSHAEGR